MISIFYFQILPGLYVGNLRDSKDSRQLDIHKITHILSIHDDEARKPFKVRHAPSTKSHMPLESFIMHFITIVFDENLMTVEKSYFDRLQHGHFFFQEKKYLIISAADSPKQDLTQHFTQTNDFIHAARFRGGHVLIHW